MRRRLLRDLNRDPGILILAYPYARTWNPISSDIVRKSWSGVESNQVAVAYIHIPFCRRKCTFCDFLAYYGRSGSEIKSYLDILFQEIAIVARNTSHIRLSAIHLGGGTPSLLNIAQVHRLVDQLTSRFSTDNEIQVTMEAFPQGIGREQLNGWRLAGINRLSYGIQFFDDQLKRSVNRDDSLEENLQILRDTVEAGFQDINLDLMCGLPNQTMESWENTLDQAIALELSHVCIFPVSVRHPGVPLYKKRYSLPPADETRRMWDNAVSRLCEAGYHRTTRHNFMRPGYKYRYEYMIAHLAPLIALGANSVGYSKDCIYRNHSDLKKYAASVTQGDWPIRAGHLFEGDDCYHNYVVRRIEYLQLNGKEFKDQFGKPLEEVFPEQIRLLERFNLARMVSGDLKLTEDGIYFTSAVKRTFFHPSAWAKFESMSPAELLLERGIQETEAIPASSDYGYRQPGFA
ncbi:MAG: coproporphyrinogen-III oxidase family protein [Gammaproteobacteria bacterium]